MKRKLIAVSLAAALVVIAVAAEPHPVQRGWTLLGQRVVSDRADHDVIPVTADRGTFKQIKLSVQRASVDFRKVIVHYGNGASQTLELRSTIPVGGETHAIDLEGDDRVIRSVEFWYDANWRRTRRATIRLFGKD